MIPLIASRIRQAFAQRPLSVAECFAMIPDARHCLCAAQRQIVRDPRSSSCCPSPSLRSGPSQAGPTLRGRGGASGCAGRVKYCFEIRAIAVESAGITTNARGSFPCASRLSSSLLSPRPLRAACRTPHRAGLPVQQPAHWSPTLLMKTSLPVLPLAAWPVRPPAGSSWACRPATRVTERLTERAACWGVPSHQGPSGPTARVVPLFFAGHGGK